MKSFRKTRKVRVPEWSLEPVTLQELSLGDIAALMDNFKGEQTDKVQFALEMVGRCLVTDDGSAVGSEWLRENVGASKLSGLMALLDHCQELNGFSADEKKDTEKTPLSRAPAAAEAGAGARKDRRRAGTPAHDA